MSFIPPGNRLEVTASHVKFVPQPFLPLLPRCPVDPWGLVMKFTLTGEPGEDKAGWMESQNQVPPPCITDTVILLKPLGGAAKEMTSCKLIPD